MTLTLPPSPSSTPIRPNDDLPKLPTILPPIHSMDDYSSMNNDDVPQNQMLPSIAYESVQRFSEAVSTQPVIFPCPPSGTTANQSSEYVPSNGNSQLLPSANPPTIKSPVPLSATSREQREKRQAARRDLHKEIERRRRLTINNDIEELALLIGASKQSKHEVLRRSLEFMRHLLQENQMLRDQLNAVRHHH